MGNTAGTTNLSAVDSNLIPVWIDVGVRLLDEHLFLGAYGQYGIATIASGANTVCTLGTESCSGHEIRAGVEVLWHFLPHGIDPWIGVGAGHEWLNVDVQTTSGTASEASNDADGWEYANAQAGVDFPVGLVRLGAFVSLSTGTLTSGSTTVTRNGATLTSSGDIQDTAMHQWLTFGLRGSVVP
jgi:hypothetical protein